MSYKPTETTIGKMLVDGMTQYIVPLYQREYSWGANQHNDFWEDLEFVIKNKDRHFIGTIVLNKKNKDDDEVFIIDGQQRLATITIIISCFKSLLKNYAPQKGKEYNQFLTNLLQAPYAPPKNRIKLSKRDDIVFEDYVLKENDLPLKFDHLILKAKKYYLEKIQSLFEKSTDSDSIAKDIFESVTKRLDLIQITVETDEEGYSIFESINSTGKELGIADLVKNHVFSISQEKDCLDKVMNLWQEIIEEVSEKNFITFLKHYYISKAGPTSEKRTYKDLKKYHLSEFKNNVLEFMQDINKESLYYSFLLTPDSAKLSPDYDVEIIETINGINSMGINQCYPFLLSLLAKAERKTIKDMSNLIKKFLFRYITCNLNPNVFTDIFIDNAKELRAGDKSKVIGKVKTLINKYNPRDEDFGRNFSTLRVSDGKLQRYILSEIEYYLTKTGPKEKVISKDITIEHILPKNPDESWKAVYDLENKEHKEYINRIGNLTLLSSKLNPKIGNKSFEKKATNKEGYGDSEIKLTQQLVNDYHKYIKWDKNAIEQRQKEMAEMALVIWKI